MDLILKYNAKSVDEIEQAKKMPIEACVQNTSVDMLATFIQKGMVDDNGIQGVSRSVAISTIDKYLEEKDKDDLLMDIMEALIKAGFLSREVDVDKVRSMKAQRVQKLKQEFDNNL